MIHYKYADADGHKIFYREAGPADAPTVLLLHGFPTSSHMFRNLIPALAGEYHVVAPDLPGFGFTESPARKQAAPPSSRSPPPSTSSSRASGSRVTRFISLTTARPPGFVSHWRIPSG